jgi:serine/threonine protein kinase
VNQQTFLDHLRQSRLLAEEQLAGLAARFGPDVPAQDLAAALVEEGVLTRYQAKQLWLGKARGLVLGQYRLLEELGQGGFGQVFKALHTMMHREVAIKVISPELVQDSRARAWFHREVLACTQLCHPNIVMAYDANEVDDTLFLAMEYVAGPNLDVFVKERGPLPVGLACELIRQAALALQHAAEKGMVHRDVKPANLLVPRKGMEELHGAGGRAAAAPVLVKVVDFGLARLHRTAPAGTLLLQNERSFLGTPDYVSPEQARNMHAVDIRSDLYSLGCAFYYALTARRPFQGTTVLEVVVQHLERDPEPLAASRPDVPQPVQEIVRRLMDKDPERRYQTPADLAAALAPWCLGAGGEVAGWRGGEVLKTSTTPPPHNPTTSPSHHPTALVPQLAFWVGPVRSRSDADDTEALVAPWPTPGPDSPATAVVPALAACAEAGPLPAAGNTPSDLSRLTPVPVAEPPEEETSAAAPPALAGQPFRAGPALRQCWQQWLAVVEAFARGDRIRVDDEGYRLVHGLLLEHCRAAAAPGGRRPTVLERLEAVVEPWLTPQTLAATDRQTLASLLQHCERLSRDLLGREGKSFWRAAALPLVVAAAAAGTWWLSETFGLTAAAGDALGGVWEFVRGRPLLSAVVAAPAVLLAGLWTLSRLLRS